LIEYRAAVLALLAAEAAPPPSATVSDDARASVALIIADMAAENERRRNWHKQPLDDWRAGRLEIRSVLTGETTIIRLHKGITA
jgi:ribonuclease HI